MSIGEFARRNRQEDSSFREAVESLLGEASQSFAELAQNNGGGKVFRFDLVDEVHITAHRCWINAMNALVYDQTTFVKSGGIRVVDFSNEGWKGSRLVSSFVYDPEGETPIAIEYYCMPAMEDMPILVDQVYQA